MKYFGKDVIDNSIDVSHVTITGDAGLCIREFGEYKNKGFYLSSTHNWEIVTDNRNQKVLIPTKR